jgi:hypothetical protein
MIKGFPIFGKFLADRFAKNTVEVADKTLEISGSASSIAKEVGRFIKNREKCNRIFDMASQIKNWDFNKSEFYSSEEVAFPTENFKHAVIRYGDISVKFSPFNALKHMARDTKDATLSEEEIKKLVDFLQQNPLKDIRINYNMNGKNDIITINQLAQKIGSGDKSDAPETAKEICDYLAAIKSNLAGQDAFTQLDANTRHFLTSRQ